MHALRMVEKSIEDDDRSGRPTLISEKLVTLVRDVIEEDRRRTIKEVADLVGSSYGTVKTIMHEHLKMNRLCARWIPKLLSSEEREKRVAVSLQFLRRLIITRYDASWYSDIFCRWVDRHRKCVKAEGHYFEKM